MTQFDSEETTRPDIPKPGLVPAVGADLCLVPATEGGVGNVAGYVGTSLSDLKTTKQP